jgi:hypothetical protein
VLADDDAEPAPPQQPHQAPLTVEERQSAKLTATEAKGFGRRKGHTEIYRSAKYTVNFPPKLKIEVAVASDDTAELPIKPSDDIGLRLARQRLCKKLARPQIRRLFFAPRIDTCCEKWSDIPTRTGANSRDWSSPGPRESAPRIVRAWIH